METVTRGGNRYRLVFLALCAFLGGCGTLGEVKPDEDRALMAKFAEGNAALKCGLCGAVYIFNQREVWMRYQTQDWHGLAIAVMKSGFRQDLTYYFLGAAAEGMGYWVAADRYYRFAGALATGPFDSERCRSINQLCGNLVFPRDIYPRLQAVSRAMVVARAAQARGRSVPLAIPVTPQPGAGAADVASGSKDGGWIDPPPAEEKAPK